MRRIALITTDLAWGGAERVVLEEALALRSAGYEPHLLGLRHAEGELASRAREAAIPVTCLPRWRTRSAAAAYLADAHIDLIHAHLYHAAELVRQITPSQPWLLFVHNIETRRLPWRAAREQRQARAATAIVAVSAATEIDWRRRTRIEDARVQILPNAVALPARALQPARREGPLRLGFLGRLEREKGVDLWMRAFPRGLPARTTLEIAGEGALEPALARWAARTGARVTRHGLVRDLDRWFERVDALIVPSRREGFGLAAAEALVRGRAIALADHPALRDLAGTSAPATTFFEPTAAGLHRAVTTLERERAARIDWAEQRGALLRSEYAPARRLQALLAMHEALGGSQTLDC